MTLIDADPGDIPAFLDRRPFVGTYSNLKAFINCEYAMNRRYIKKDLPFVPTEATEFGNAAHAAMEARVGKGKVLPEHFRQWEKYATPFDKFEVKCEQKLGITSNAKAVGYWDNLVWIRGVADNTIIQNDKALLTDWKCTSSGSRFEDVFELEMHALLLKAHFPQLNKISGRFVYLKQEELGRLYDLSNFTKTWNEINRLMTLVQEKRQSGEWAKKKSGLCGWCDCSECENHFVSEKRK